MINPENIIDYKYNDYFQSFSYKKYKNIEINLKGKVQTLNATEAIETIDILNRKGFFISEKAIREGLKTVVHRARMEKICDNPCIIFDGGHNENAIKNLKQNVNQYYKNQQRVYIISILKTKDYSTIIKELLEDKDAIFYFTDGVIEKPYVEKEKLKEEAEQYIDSNKINIASLEEALRQTKILYKDRVIFVVGSFYVYKKVMDILKDDE